MKNLKTKIKNDLWRWNYILPFVKKHQYDEKGKVYTAKKVINAYKEIRPVRGKNGRTVGCSTKTLLESISVSFSPDSRFVYFIDTAKTVAVPGNVVSNFPLAYDKIIHGTWRQLCEQAGGDDEYGKEAHAVDEGVTILTKRIIDELKKSALRSDGKARLVNYFERLLDHKAEHFEEALQRILFFNQIMWQTRHRLNGLGRLDKILGDLYDGDIRSGLLTKDTAHELVGDFLSQLSRYSGYKSDALEGDIGQIIVLGGAEPDGGYFCNDLTKIFLTEQAKLGKPDPKTLLRVSVNTPEEIMRIAVEALGSKTGSPLFSNDDRVIPALLAFGIPAEDAYDYCTSACWEPYFVGKSLDQNNIAVFDFFAALDHILNAAEEPAQFDELVQKYIEENKDRFTSFLRDLDGIKWAKDPLVSMFMDGCSEKRRDVSEGGTVYNNYGVTTVAVSNVVDSLLNIKELVYETHKYSIAELNRARNSDFQDAEELYAHLRSHKHFGHDDEDAVSLTERITESVAGIVKSFRNRLNGSVKYGLSSPGYNILCKRSAADLSGRKKGMPYNTHISCLDAPYTEVVNFASCLRYDEQRFNGNVVDLFMTPQLIGDNIDKFVLFMKGAVKAGFFQMQMNMMDSRTLIDAKAHPENYHGLIVRVWGFSAYFNDLPESYKDLLIERAVAAEKAV